jgi:diaminopropionate ammonia-lyase
MSHARDIALDAADIWPDYRPTRLIELPALARAVGVGRLLAKLECERPLGNFKALGGMVAGLRALARVAGVARLRELRGGGRALPQLVCASAGNHGLAVAAAARWAGTQATVYLAEGANRARAARIEALGARIVWTPGTYDDAVEQASKSDGLVIADTSTDPDDPVVRDVMDGYALIAREVIAQLRDGGEPTEIRERGDLGERGTGKGVTATRREQRPTHLFLQGGVGGLAAALTQGLQPSMRSPQRALVVEPQSVACVAAALDAGHPVHIGSRLDTRAEMLACGLASAPAVRILREHGASAVLIPEELLDKAVTHLRDLSELNTTASGATGFAGLLHVSSQPVLRERHELNEESCVLLVVTEGAIPSTSTIFGTS